MRKRSSNMPARRFRVNMYVCHARVEWHDQYDKFSEEFLADALADLMVENALEDDGTTFSWRGRFE